MKTKITIVFTILFSLHSFGQNFIFEGLNYKVSSVSTVEVSTNTGIVGTVNLPSNINYENVNYLVTGIGEKAFLDCTGLTSITIPNSVTSIGFSAFNGCNGLTSVIIPNSVTSISNGAFAFCNVLTAVTIPNSVISIGSSAFESCYSLTSVTIPNSIVSIGNSTFGLCTGLKSIIIPNSVTSIGDYAFALCNNLTSVTVDWTNPLFVNSKVFEYLTLSTITLNIPEGTETAYKAANVWKEFKIATLGTNQFSVNTPVTFYPNPAKSQINFTQEINSLEVFDIAGKKVKSFQNPSTTYDVSNLEKGIYLLKATSAEGKYVSEKMIKE